MESLDAALKAAAEGARLVLVHFANPELPLSAEMDRTTFAEDSVAGIARLHFASVRFVLPADRDRFRRMTGGRGGLGTCILDPGGDTIAILPGYADAKAMLAFLKNTRKHWPALRRARKTGDPMALADAYAALDHRRKAEELYRKALPGDHGMGHAKLARLLALRGRNVEAMDHVKRAWKRGAGEISHEQLFVTEGLCLLIALKPQEAISRLGTDIHTFPSIDDEVDGITYVLGVAYHDSGNPKRALEELEKLVRQWPDSRWRPAAEERILHIKNPPPGHTHSK